MKYKERHKLKEALERVAASNKIAVPDVLSSAPGPRWLLSK